MSNKSIAEKIAESTGRKAVPMATFESTNDFEAIDDARNFMQAHGYNVGSMCRDEPMACSKNADYIAKWRNIGSEEWPKIEALIVAKDMRRGPVVECYELV